MIRSPSKQFGSNPELTTPSSQMEEAGSVTLRKRKRDDDFSECFKEFSAEIMATLAAWKTGFDKDLSKINNNLNNIIKNDMIKLTESSSEMKAELIKIRQEYSEVKESVYAMGQKMNNLKNEVTSLQESTQFISNQYDDLKKSNDLLIEDNKKINRLESELIEVQKHNKWLKQEMNSNDQRDRLLNLEIVGIPEVKDEYLPDTLIKIAKAVDIDMSLNDITHINRVTPRVKLQGRPRVIVARISTRQLKDNLISASKKTRLTTGALGLLGDPKPIYINEQLTIYNKQLLKMCKEAAKIKQYQFVWTKNGRISVRKNDTSPQIRILSEEDLKKMI